MRDTTFSILKALAIIMVVLSHAGVPGWLGNVLYLVHVPAFFLCAGYFFNTRYLHDERFIGPSCATASSFCWCTTCSSPVAC